MTAAAKKVLITVEELETNRSAPGYYDPGVLPIKQSIVHETKETAFGTGGGILYVDVGMLFILCRIVATTSEGCLIASSGILDGIYPLHSIRKLNSLPFIERVDPAELGRNTAHSLLKELKHGGCFDEYLVDQIILFMALAEGNPCLFCRCFLVLCLDSTKLIILLIF